MRTFLFGTGIECSYPKVDGGRRRDQLEETGHYRHWRTDLELCRELGVDFVRYGIPYYRMHTGPRLYDWSFTDEVFPVIRELGLRPIVDLCHFGVPDWAGDFQNEDWPDLFVDFAEAFARRYPWVRFYTPANEIHVCARMSACVGIWNEQKCGDRAFVRANTNLCRACLNAMERILRVRPDAVFVQSETAEIFLERYPETRDAIAFHNEIRFLTFDILYGRGVSGAVLAYLLDNGETVEGYHAALELGRRVSDRCIMGLDYYAWNERTLLPDGASEAVGPAVGWHTLARQYYGRYRRPMMLTETNCLGVGRSSEWLWRVWHNVQMLRSEGVPIVGFTWYSLQDQIDWDIQLREIRGTVNEVGLYDLDRRPNPVAAEFRTLIERYHDLPLLADFPFAELTDPPS